MKFLRNIFFAAFTVAVLFLSACGGGSSDGAATGTTTGTTGPLPAKNVRWTPPAQFSDRTPLNPLTDLDNYEIYVKQISQFSDTDPPSAVVAAVDPGTHQLTTTFNLANLGPFLQKGITYYVSMRSVATDGLKSDFSAPAAFSF